MGTKTFNNYEDLLTFTRASKGHALRPVSYGTELVTNGDFATDSDWVKTQATISGGVCEINSPSGSYAGVYQAIPVTVGKMYFISVEVVSVVTGSALVNVEGGSVGTLTTSGFITTAYVATDDTLTVEIKRGGGVTEFTIDNVSLKEVTFDQPDGTLTLFEHPDNVPRVEWDAQRNRLGLLVEEQRTNLVTSSDATGWTVAAASATDNTEITLGAFTGAVVSSNGADWHRYRPANITVTSGTTYAVTLFYEYGTSGDVLLNFRDVAGANESRITGAWGSLIISLQNAGTLTVLEETALPQNVKKIVAKFVPNFSGNFEFGIGPNSNTSGETVIAYAAQCEQASFGTSYMKTTGATATRSADVASMELTEFGYNHDEGTVLIDFNMTYDSGGSKFPRSFEITAGTSATDRILCNVSESSNNLVVNSFVNNVTQAPLTLKTSLSGTAEGKVAFAFKKDDFAASDDGDTVVTDTSGTFEPSSKRTKLTFGGTGTGTSAQMNGHIKSFKYYPRRLTNAQLEDLSS